MRSSRCESREDLCAKTFQLDEVFSGENTSSTFNLSIDKVVRNKTNNKIQVPLIVANELKGILFLEFNKFTVKQPVIEIKYGFVHTYFKFYTHLSGPAKNLYQGASRVLEYPLRFRHMDPHGFVDLVLNIFIPCSISLPFVPHCLPS